jgi:hypothetical protein
MTTRLHSLTLKFGADGRVHALCIRKAGRRAAHRIHVRFDGQGWQQWGEVNDVLRENVCLVETLGRILREHGYAVYTQDTGGSS